MYNSLHKKPSIVQSVKKLAKEFADENNPNFVSNMDHLNNKIYQELTPGKPAATKLQQDPVNLGGIE